jgi:hypothetical protein
MNLPKLAERQPITSDCSVVRYSNIGRSMSALGQKRFDAPDAFTPWRKRIE